MNAISVSEKVYGYQLTETRAANWNTVSVLVFTVVLLALPLLASLFRFYVHI